MLEAVKMSNWRFIAIVFSSHVGPGRVPGTQAQHDNAVQSFTKKKKKRTGNVFSLVFFIQGMRLRVINMVKTLMFLMG